MASTATHHGPGADGLPLCFLHIPKCGGTSLRVALEASLPHEAVNPKRCDTYGFDGFEDFAGMAPFARALIAVTDDEIAELATSRAVSGHFRLQTLLRITSRDRIATVLREPRSRLLSLYAFIQAVPSLATAWSPLPVQRTSAGHAGRSLEEFLAEPLIASDTDNIVCRMLLDGAWDLPALSFIAEPDVADLTDAAITRIDELGFVGILELGDQVWRGFGRLFGTDVSPIRANVTRDLGDAAQRPVLGPPHIIPRTIELLEQRTRADRSVYEYVLGKTVEDAERVSQIRDAAFAEQLLGLIPHSASDRLAEPDAVCRSSKLEAELHRVSDDLVRHGAWLDAIQTSRSWRLTAPLRYPKRIVRDARAGSQ